MDYVSTYMTKVNAAKRFVIDTVNEAAGRAGLNPVYRSEARAVAEATEVIGKALDVLVARGMTRTEAVNKVRRLNLTAEEFQRLAKSGSKKPKVHLAEPDDKDEDDKADEQLDKLASAVQRAHPTAGFSKQQAQAWCLDHLPEARELLRQSKQRSVNKNYPGQHVFDKAESPVSQPLPAGVAKMSDADLTSAYHEGRFDKLGDHKPPGPSRANDGGRDGTHRDENQRPRRRQLGANLNDVDSADSLVDMPVDIGKIKALMKAGLNFDQAASKAMREAGINPPPTSP